MLFYNTIYPKTLELLKKLQQKAMFSGLQLVGGTSLALQIGHRISVDIDLFGQLKADTISLNAELATIAEYETLQQTENIHIYSMDGIKLDIVNYPYSWLKPPLKSDGIVLASIDDIAAMKLSAITGRGSKKDFIDLYFLLQQYTLKQMLSLYENKYTDGSTFQVIRSLLYFDDAEDEPMPNMLTNVPWEEVKKTISDHVKTCSTDWK